MFALNKNILVAFYWIQLVMFVVLPGGYLLGINFKVLCFAIFNLSLGIYLLKKGVDKKFYLILISFILFIVFYLFVATLPQSNASKSFTEARLFIVTFVFPLVTYLLLKESLITPEKLIKVAIYAHIVYILIKLSFFFSVLNGVIDAHFIKAFIFSVFNVKVIIHEIFPRITRIQFNLDVLSFVVFALMLTEKGRGIFKKRTLYWMHFLLFASVCISFSRFIFAAYVVLLAIYVTLSITNIKVIISLSIVGFAFVGLFYDEISILLENRFSGKATEESDYVRKQQYTAILEEFKDKPLIGNGLGGYSPRVIRDHNLPFSYELQLQSFLMKFGILGSSIIFYIILAFYINSLRINNFTSKAIVSSAFILWISANFFNPYLTSSLASVVFAIFVTSNFMFNNQDTQIVEG